MNTSYFFRLLTLVATVSLLAACAEPHEEPFKDYLLTLTQQDFDRISRDTITPPYNPLLPPDNPSRQYTISGILSCERIASVDGYYPCLIVEGQEEDTRTYYFLYRWGKPIRFNHPDMKDLHIGDTLRVTGEVSFRLANDITYTVQHPDERLTYLYAAPAYTYEYTTITH